ncbi:MAG: PRC-barrel domain-containing protein, partial [Rubrobacteraceae bacterium]
MASDERLRELEEKYEGFTVYDRDGDKIGKVDDLFVDDSDREEYIGVKMGLLGLSGTTLIPMEMARVDERERRIEVSDTKEHVKDAPSYSDDDEVNADFEDRIRAHFGMEGAQQTGESGSYGRYVGDAAGGGAASGAAAEARSSQDDMRRGDRDADDRYSGAAMGGAENRDRTDQDRMDQDRMGRERTDRDRGPD